MNGCVIRKKIEDGKWIGIYSALTPEKALYDLLKDGVRQEKLGRKILIVKDIYTYLKDLRIVALFENACLRIEEGRLETTFISSIVKIPKELEKHEFERFLQSLLSVSETGKREIVLRVFHEESM